MDGDECEPNWKFVEQMRDHVHSEVAMERTDDDRQLLLDAQRTRLAAKRTVAEWRDLQVAAASVWEEARRGREERARARAERQSKAASSRRNAKSKDNNQSGAMDGGGTSYFFPVKIHQWKVGNGEAVAGQDPWGMDTALS